MLTSRYSSIGAAKCLDRRDQECMLLDCNPLAQARCDDTNNPVQLATLVSECQEFLPSLSLQLLSTPDSIEPAIFQDLVHQNDEDSYANFQLRLKQLHGVMRLLSSLPDIGSWCSDGTTCTVIFRNLYRLRQRITEMNLEVESTLFHVLDAHPEKTASSLKLVMKQKPAVNLPNISFRNFETLGVGRWLDDEVINYFVKKWCSRSHTTLGLNTWFACQFIFQEHSCIHARTALSADIERRVLRWCRAAEREQGLTTWDRVFIPINENNSHWYSACIHFGNRQIDIYDSLRDVCLMNRQKSVEMRKNTNTMLVLMWLAETLGRLRGEEVQLKNNPMTTWRCDPHTEVPFQPNFHDCGVHTLWHLKHVLQFGAVQRDCKSPHFRFSDDMIGKRLRLAQEILDDCGL